MDRGAGPSLIWRDGGVPVAARFDDPYFSLQDGAAETAHVFLAGNDLPGRFRDGFRIAELGFGTGLNLAVALAAWRDAGIPGRLEFTSFEAFPMPAADMARALSRWPALAAVLAPVLAALEAGRDACDTDAFRFRLVIGDAGMTVPAWDGRADAWFLDGFSPARNPEMWDPALMAAIAARTAPGGSFATYTAAGHVRRALEAAGFAVVRRPGFGTKRHMTAGRLP